MKFRTRLTLAVALLVLLLIGTELLISYLGATRNDQRVATANLQATSRLVGTTIDLLLDQASRDLAMISRSAYLNEQGRSRVSINQRLNDFRNGSPVFGRLRFYSADGTLRADADSRTTALAADQSLLLKAMAGADGFVVSGGNGTAAELHFFAPVRREAGEQPKGVVIGGLLLDHLRTLLEHFQAYRLTGPDHLQVALLDRSGRVIFAGDGYRQPSRAPDAVPTVEQPQLVLENRRNLQILTRVTGLSSTDQGEWYLQVTIPKTQIYAEARSRLQRKLLVNSVMCTLGILLIYLLAGRLSRPLEEIAEAVRRRGNGNSDALAQLPERHDEFGLLQENLQEMSNRLHEHTERLTLSEERFHALFDNMGEGVALHRLLYRQDGGPDNYLLVEVNQSYQIILGMAREQVLGRLATELYPGEEPPFLERFAEVVATGCSCSFEAYFAPLDRHFSISACRIGADGFATIFSDITAKKWHEETLRNTMAQLKSANESKSRFLAVMSHEIRTPLNGITGMVQLLRDMEMPPLQREFLDNIDSSAESLLSVINDILDFSKIEAGRMDLEELPFEPCTLLNNTLRVLRLRAQAKGLMLSLVCDEQLAPVLVGDPHRLGQVLTNLVNNAIKFTVGGEIVVTAGTETLDQETVRLTVSVRDPGIGMDQATQQTIFDPFIQADSSTTRKYGGTGLGLAICKQLMELMQGGISVSSRPGQGSTFTLSAPLKRGVLPQAPEAPPKPAATLDQPLRILVAEDQPVNQRFVSEILRKQRHSTLLANNGQEAVALWQREQVDLVLMDIQMPVMDGLKALAAIRAAEDGQKRHTPIVALTAHAIVGDRERLLHAGFDGYLSKPLQAAALFVEMARVLELIARERKP